MLLVLIVGSLRPPGRQKTWDSEDKSVLASKQDRENGDDRNGEKHVRKLMDFFEERVRIRMNVSERGISVQKGDDNN